MSSELACAPDGCVLTVRCTAVLQCCEAPKTTALNVEGNRSTRDLHHIDHGQHALDSRAVDVGKVAALPGLHTQCQVHPT